MEQWSLNSQFTVYVIFGLTIVCVGSQDVSTTSTNFAINGIQQKLSRQYDHEIHTNENNVIRKKSAKTTGNKGKLEFNELWKNLLKEEGATEEEILQSLPSSYDYRNKYQYVRDIGQNCSASWSFAIAGCVESLYRIHRQEQVILSSQQLIDCDTKDYGCRRGRLFEQAYSEMIRLGGLQTEESYPYVGSKDEPGLCNMSEKAKKYTIDGYTRLPVGEEEKMKIWLVKRGPFIVNINPEKLPYYSGGVLRVSDAVCSRKYIDANHAVIVVGYGMSSDKMPYWLIKNSWGVGWGESGFFRVFLGENICGLSTDVTAPIVDKASSTSSTKWTKFDTIIIIIVAVVSVLIALAGACILCSGIRQLLQSSSML